MIRARPGKRSPSGRRVTLVVAALVAVMVVAITFLVLSHRSTGAGCFTFGPQSEQVSACSVARAESTG
ncbi:MAG: hypothetical protein ACYDD0_00770 [Candidatus Dormibacteria bacterium]